MFRRLVAPALLLTVAFVILSWAGVASASAGKAGVVEQFVGGRSRKMFDEQTMLKSWIAVDVAGIPAARKTEVQPALRDRNYKLTGKTKPPVSAVRCAAGDPVFNLDFGTLDPGAYVVRVIAMVKSDDIQQYRKPCYVDFKVNDKAGGGISYYRQRIPYWDDFYSVTDLYFNVDEKRACHGTLTVGQGSMVDLYVHNIEFHDCLRGLVDRAAKEKPGLFTYEDRARLRAASKRPEVFAEVSKEVALDAYLRTEGPALSPEKRRQRDDLLWNAVPQMNSQYVAEYDESGFFRGEQPGAMSAKDAAEKYGTWTLATNMRYAWFSPLALKNDKLKLTWTMADLDNHQPLPAPYPFKDDGGGVYFPARNGQEHAQHWMPVALQMGNWWEGVRLPLAPYHGGDFVHRLPYLYHALDDKRAARDAAFLLCRWAYIYPSFTDAQMLGYAVIAPASMYNRDIRLVQRRFGYQRPANLMTGLLYSYDFLFDYIKGNQELAQAVGRFIPWVKTDADVRRLIETRMVQYAARQVMRWHRWNDKGTPGMLMDAAAVEQDPTVTRPWMETLWTNTWVYPYPAAGLPDYVSTSTQRDGTTTIGSVFYAWEGSPFVEIAKLTHQYVQNGGDRKYDLADLERYRKLVDSGRFALDSSVSGGYPVTIGDVGGPAKPRLFMFMPGFEDNFRTSYEWSGAADLAWLLANYYGRRGESDAQWQAVERAAAAFGRNPFLAQRSRVLSDWTGILESGQASDDFRFKRSLYMRVGTGHGHAHSDTLDLQMLAHGVRVMNDVGHRGSYGQPSPGDTILHNEVEVNGEGGREGNWQSHAWIPVMAPTPGAQYMEGIAISPGGRFADVKYRSRQSALIDVSDGTPSAKAPAPLPYTDKTVFGADVVTPESYVFDVQRLGGGDRHTFCFHGTWSDEFDVNIENRSDKIEGFDERYLRKFLRGDVAPYVGDAPDVVEATWRLRRTAGVINAIKRDGKAVALKQGNAEQQMLGVNYHADSPAKYTRLRLFDHKGDHLMVAWMEPNESNVQMTWPFLMIRREGKSLQSVYPALIEPYAGDPFITAARELPVAGNEDDARRAVALEVTTKNGRTDVCFSDGRLKDRRVGDLTINGRFAYVSRDDKGLRLVELVEGTRLETPWGTLSLPAADCTAKVVKVDYWQRKLWLDAALPARDLAGAVVEIGNDQHKTSFTVADAAVEDGRTVLTFAKAADLSYAHVTRDSAADGVVCVNVQPVDPFPGMNAGLTCTNDDNSRSWKCRVLSRDNRFGDRYQLEGKVAAGDFAEGSVIRVWEYGVGDTVRIACHAAVRRGDDGKLGVESNVEAAWTAK